MCEPCAAMVEEADEDPEDPWSVKSRTASPPPSTAQEPLAVEEAADDPEEDLATGSRAEVRSMRWRSTEAAARPRCPECLSPTRHTAWCSQWAPPSAPRGAVNLHGSVSP